MNTLLDKGRRDQIDIILKQVGKNEEKFQKETKRSFGKKLESLNMNRASTIAQFNAEYTNFYDSLKGLQESYINSEIKIKSLIHPNEWDSIMNKVLKLPAKAKIRKDLLAENKKLHDRLLKACNDRIPDSAGKVKARTYVDQYLVKGNALTDGFLDLNYKYITAIRPYAATRPDFEKPRVDMIDLRRNYTSYLIDMRFKLMSITPEKNWDGLAKELNNDFNYLGAGVSK